MDRLKTFAIKRLIAAGVVLGAGAVLPMAVGESAFEAAAQPVGGARGGGGVRSAAPRGRSSSPRPSNPSPGQRSTTAGRGVRSPAGQRAVGSQPTNPSPRSSTTPTVRQTEAGLDGMTSTPPLQRTGTLLNRNNTLLTRNNTTLNRTGTLLNRNNTLLTRSNTLLTRNNTLLTRSGTLINQRSPRFFQLTSAASAAAVQRANARMMASERLMMLRNRSLLNRLNEVRRLPETERTAALGGVLQGILLQNEQVATELGLLRATMNGETSPAGVASAGGGVPAPAGVSAASP